MKANLVLAEKARLREEILRKRNLISPEVRAQKSRAIMERLYKLEEFRSARLLHIFVSFGSEASTEDIIKDSLKEGKRIVVPIIEHNARRLILSEITDYDLDLAPGRWGILEPKKEAIRFIDPDHLDLILAPGVAFDASCRRLGHGAGYYDRLLAGCKDRPFTIGLAYEMQVIDDVPVMEYDVKIDGIITEERLIKDKSSKFK
ncbi:MAG: 5-formyltetrahydrofolate cyclo-ligase [Nitrospirota bacterium]